MQDQQLCQQPQGWKCLAPSHDPGAEGIAYLGVAVGLLMSVPLVGPATPELAALPAMRTLNPTYLECRRVTAASSLAGHIGIRPSLEGHTFTWHSFDESGKPCGIPFDSTRSG